MNVSPFGGFIPYTYTWYSSKVLVNLVKFNHNSPKIAFTTTEAFWFKASVMDGNVMPQTCYTDKGFMNCITIRLASPIMDTQSDQQVKNLDQEESSIYKAILKFKSV